MPKIPKSLETMEDSWTIDPRKLDLSLFISKEGEHAKGVLPYSAEDQFTEGAYAYGPKLRTHPHGDTFLALSMQDMRVVEIDRYHLPPYDFQQQTELLKNLSMASQVKHRNLPEILALGIKDEFPFMVRPLIVGRDLNYMLPKLPQPSRVAILYRVFRLVDYLEKESPFPGAYQFGECNLQSIHLSFSGRVLVTGLGSQSQPSEPNRDPFADRRALRDLTEQLDVSLKAYTDQVLTGVQGLEASLRELSRMNPEGCARTEESLSAYFRTAFLEEIQEDRAFYGLHTLQ